MRAFYLVVFFCGIAGHSVDAIAAITLKIINGPQQIYVYAPIRLIGEIENVGQSTEAVSLTDAWEFQVGQSNRYLPLPSEHQYDIGEHFIAILHPGEKYYVSKDVSQGFAMDSQFTDEGVYEVRMVLSGVGQCIPSILSKPYNLKRDISAPGERAIFKCWRGKVYSQPVKIAVSHPTSADDLEALNFVQLEKDHQTDSHPRGTDFALRYESLRQKYPSSYYTFVAGLYAAAASFGQPHLVLKQTLALQPQHPLKEYALLRLAMEEIDRQLPIDKNIESQLSPAVWEFIKQYRNDVKSWRKYKH